MTSPQAVSRTPPGVPGHQRLLQVVVAVAIVGGPLGYLLGGLLAPAIRGTGQANIAANAAANAAVNAVHLAAFMVASFLLPIGAFGLARLAYPGSPWLATAGGLLGVVGWLPFSALAALDDLTATMAAPPDSGSYPVLLDRFSGDPVMATYLIIYIVGHLVAYVLLGLALLRAGVLPRWAAWSMIASSPVMIAAFVLGSSFPFTIRITGGIAVGLLVLGSLPAARQALGRQ
jgi:hypothetical protein